MEPDVSIMMVWPMAAMEAQALGWPEIEPAHLLCAALKFAELGVDDLERLGEAAGNAGQLRQHHRDLGMRLEELWGIAIPDVSRPLRRGLRRRGDGEPNSRPGGMIHRSDAARGVFRTAQAMAERDGRQQFCLADLVDVILRDPDQWVRRGLDQHKVLSSLQVAQRNKAIDEWGDLFVALTPSGPADMAERKRILADPVVRVLADTLAKPGPRPCLLIHGPDRTAFDVLIDLLNHPGEEKPPKVTRIDSRALLERLHEDAGFSAGAFLDFLTDQSHGKTVWFVDSLHRYLSDELVPAMFKVRFTRWLKQTSGRFVFAISESQCDKLAEQYPDWKNTFRSIWVREVRKSSFTEL